MRIVLSVIGKFHSFDLAAELQRHGVLGQIFSGYPHFKLRDTGVAATRIVSRSWLQSSYMALRGRVDLPAPLWLAWEQWAGQDFDRFTSRHLPDCDVFVGLSGTALRTGRIARSRGAKHVCDRGSSHIRTQDQLLRDEHDRWGLRFAGIHPPAIEREEAEYAEADAITVPSTFALRTFVERGYSISKLKLLPYGVNLDRFRPLTRAQNGRFDVLFVGGMSVRKGVPYLLQAYKVLQHPAKSITFAGAPCSELIALMKQRQLWPHDARVLGHVPQPQLSELMGRSHVMVLPSIEEGLALVQAQAMASGCVVIGSTNSGAEDLLAHGSEGFVAPVRDPVALADIMQRLADDPMLREQIRSAAIARTQMVGGWKEYGDSAVTFYRRLLTAKQGSAAGLARIPREKT